MYQEQESEIFRKMRAVIKVEYEGVSGGDGSGNGVIEEDQRKRMLEIRSSKLGCLRNI